MSEKFSCGDAAALVSYLYDESSPEERDLISAHLEECAPCTREVAMLGGTRRDLAAWVLPNVALGFRIASDREIDTPPRVWWRQPMPAWMQVAAAAALFTAGLAFGAVRGSSQAPSAIVATRPAVAAVPTASQRDLTELEERLRAEMTQLRAASSAPVVTRSRDDGSAAVLAQVRALIAESEERQRRELALRTTQIVRDVETQRRADLTQVQRTMGQMEGLTGAEMRQQREMLNYMINVSQRR